MRRLYGAQICNRFDRLEKHITVSAFVFLQLPPSSHHQSSLDLDTFPCAIPFVVSHLLAFRFANHNPFVVKMKYSFAAAALFAGATSVYAQGESAQLSPSSGPPSGCNSNYDGSFEIQIVAIDQTMTPVKRSEAQPSIARRQASAVRIPSTCNF